MGGYNFEVIGVLEKRKAGFFGENEEDNAVYIPFRTAKGRAGEGLPADGDSRPHGTSSGSTDAV